MADDAPRPVRRGLPRTSEPSTPEPTTPEPTTPATSQPTAESSAAPTPAPAPRRGLPRPAAVAPSASADADPTVTPSPVPAVPEIATSTPAPAPTPSPAAAAKAARRPVPLVARIVIGLVGLLVLAAVAVLVARWLIGLDGVASFITTYPGQYPLPAFAPVGFPAWVQWQHFLSGFLMLLIIRSGWQVRTQKRPTVFWTPRRATGNSGRISLTLWFHQSLDVLWLANGLLFIVLLFVSGQWTRIIPTSWAVFPNALTALLRYVSLDWPTEDGWVNYNSLQQLSYFVVVFVAAPLAVVTGVRMSGFWPKNAPALSRRYPIEWARAVHFPVMLFFVLFIVVHVGLVLSTGALRNLNHMYGGQDAVNWTGFWIFFASLVVMVGALVAARPLVLAPIARLMGRVGR